MKFGYSYKTSDGVRHESVFHADTKEDVFASLRAKGIKPIKVWEVERKHPVRTRIVTWSIVALVAAAIAAGVSVALNPSGVPEVAQEEDRSQIYGDPGLLQMCEAQGWSNVFGDEGTRFLARFAQPGHPVRLSGQAWRKIVADALKANPKPLRVAATDGEEIAKMKRMINGMKRELAQYIADGGSVEEYIGEVLERQSIEEKIVINFMTEFEKLERSVKKENRDEVIAEWNAKNVILRQMGLRTVLIPEKIESLGE